MKVVDSIEFPKFNGVRCLMMPYIQGDPDSIPLEYRGYADILESVYIQAGDRGFLTIDESLVEAGNPHRGQRAKFGRALHTEAGVRPKGIYAWGGAPSWGSDYNVTLDWDAQIILANNLDNTCAVWDAVHMDTTIDGDIGHVADQYPYEDAKFLKSGEVCQIGILTPHESMPVSKSTQRQFLRIVSSGVHGREPYFTRNPLMS